ncbi:TetR/AcrR family transcriptional regulator [Streptomyces noursei]|uniref:TetR/AcrR family transcriptional regulator n=1 Tax=Streptomyces TaxID=1883 RepID=UPI0035DDD967
MSTRGGRERILRAAMELIARDGFDGVRIADIAERADVSTAAVHYHFATRPQLLTASLTFCLEAAEAWLKRQAQSESRTLPAQRLADLIDFGLPLTPGDAMEWRLWHELERHAARSTDLARTLSALYERLLEPYRAVIGDGLDDGVFHDCEPQESATAALALLTGLATRLLAHDPAFTHEQARTLAARQLARIVGFSGPLPLQPLIAQQEDIMAGPVSTQDAPKAPVTRRRRAPRSGSSS